jgi:hypothetical protein
MRAEGDRQTKVREDDRRGLEAEEQSKWQGRQAADRVHPRRSAPPRQNSTLVVVSPSTTMPTTPAAQDDLCILR